MIKQGLKNYFISLKYFFTPLGTMFLGMMLGFSVMFPGILAAARELIDGVKGVAGSVNLDVGVLFDEIWADIVALDWNNPPEALKSLLSIEWLNGVLTDVLQTVLGTDFETFKLRIVELVGTFTAQVVANVVAFFIFWILGFFAGFWLLKFLIRRSVARRSLWKFIIANFINSIGSTMLVVLISVLFAKWRGSIYISVTAALLLVAAAEFLQAYLLYAYKKVRLSTVLNFKNVGEYMLTNLLIFIVSIIFTLFAIAVNKLMGIFVGLSFAVIAFIVIGLNAESYVQSVVKRLAEAGAVNEEISAEADAAVASDDSAENINIQQGD